MPECFFLGLFAKIRPFVAKSKPKVETRRKRKAETLKDEEPLSPICLSKRPRNSLRLNSSDDSTSSPIFFSKRQEVNESSDAQADGQLSNRVEEIEHEFSPDEVPSSPLLI